MRPFALVKPHASFTLTSRHSHDADGDAAIHAATSAKASIMTTLILEEMHQLEGMLNDTAAGAFSCSARRPDPAFMRITARLIFWGEKSQAGWRDLPPRVPRDVAGRVVGAARARCPLGAFGSPLVPFASRAGTGGGRTGHAVVTDDPMRDIGWHAVA
jgi:hypothetical protein